MWFQPAWTFDFSQVHGQVGASPCIGHGKVGFVVKPLLETIGRQVKARIQQLEARGLVNLA